MSNSALHPIHTDQAPAAIGPYSQAVSANFAFKGTVVFCSGQIGLDPATGNLRDGFEAQVDQALANMQAVIKAAGGDLSGIVKLTLFLTDLGNFGVVNGKLEALLPKPYPARSTVGVASLPKGAQFEIEAIVVV
ncbi:MAG TPA: Rid family detoxifying hydrolase [Casimicrobium huifangae]|jgi:reactive intermediate/imine deaminase|uniref:Rid family detoxifying hydrolase n=1 Tax=Casimicrobium huifangae TaxID=2591109 RepID=UPI0012ECAF20|nr:Rid family detoxifying hydrolase [Casimicrobium huifangae]HOB01632.1 Rid family detoxifying hydrolase [Casimicrobium huifangae]HQA33789.1 Rid family detoxifying hydrolase [Casimicrobium huifangae]HQD64386.1 Rid family detoxifying hydrolase [Casimicrobium huifangae]